MKMIMGFLAGVAAGSIIAVLFLGGTFGVRAGTGEETAGLEALLPDIGQIYRESLSSPYREVAKEIKDEDIARFYRSLMERTGLDRADRN